MAGSSPETVADETRRAIERWFAARGVPQLIEGYSTEHRIDARAVPLIGGWIVVATVVIWLLRPAIYFAGRSLGDVRMRGSADPSPAADLGATLVALVATGLLIGTVLWIRRHPPFGSHTRLDVLDIAVVGLAPGAVTAALAGDAGAVPGIAAFVLSGVGVIYAVVALGVPELSGWGLRYLRETLPSIATLVARTLPLLLILVVFLLFAAELWQVAHALGVGDVVVVMALLAAVGGVLVVTQASEEIRAIEERGPTEPVDDLLAGTPADNPGGRLPPPAGTPRPLRRLERLNLMVLMLVSQLIQSLFVALMVALFLVALGFVAVPTSVQAAWVGAPVRDLLQLVVLGEPRTLSSELLVAAALLGGTCGLYFTGLALTDATYRAQFHARVVSDIERIMAVRSVYHRTSAPAT